MLWGPSRNRAEWKWVLRLCFQDQHLDHAMGLDKWESRLHLIKAWASAAGTDAPSQWWKLYVDPQSGRCVESLLLGCSLPNAASPGRPVWHRGSPPSLPAAREAVRKQEIWNFLKYTKATLITMGYDYEKCPPGAPKEPTVQRRRETSELSRTAPGGPS